MKPKTVAQLLEERNMAVAEFARLIQRGPETALKIVRMDWFPRVKTVRLIARALKVKPDQINFGFKVADLSHCPECSGLSWRVEGQTCGTCGLAHAEEPIPEQHLRFGQESPDLVYL